MLGSGERKRFSSVSFNSSFELGPNKFARSTFQYKALLFDDLTTVIFIGLGAIENILYDAVTVTSSKFVMPIMEMEPIYNACKVLTIHSSIGFNYLEWNLFQRHFVSKAPHL
jgi:hypothetical protein